MRYQDIISENKWNVRSLPDEIIVLGRTFEYAWEIYAGESYRYELLPNRRIASLKYEPHDKHIRVSIAYYNKFPGLETDNFHEAKQLIINDLEKQFPGWYIDVGQE